MAHYVAGGVTFEPTPLQRPRVPVWVAGRWPNRKPLHRAARYDGYFPIDLEAPGQLAELVGELHERRTSGSPVDVVVEGWPGDEPAPWATAGATWWLVFSISPFDIGATAVREVMAGGPTRRSGRSGQLGEDVTGPQLRSLTSGRSGSDPPNPNVPPRRSR